MIAHFIVNHPTLALLVLIGIALIAVWSLTQDYAE